MSFYAVRVIERNLGMNKSKAINNFYYRLKPIIPRKIQIMLRSRVALQRRQKYLKVWPIFEGACARPDKWSGWPDKKQFSFILTHDVDTARGQEKCYQLAMIEEELGLRSSFNFVPEGYDVSLELIDELKKKGFEVGVHGLTHDNKLYKSEAIFQWHALRINHYLDKWGSVGFRSPSMFHNLEWIHALDIEYDASTFDTDPFEPQPEGVGTIFPFWVLADDPAAISPAISLSPATIRPEVQPVTCNLQPATAKLQPPQYRRDR